MPIKAVLQTWRERLSLARLKALCTWDRLVELGLLLAALALALLLRYTLRSFTSLDYESFISRWYQLFETQGFAALGDKFSNYNPPYLYLLYLATRVLPALSPLAKVKMISVAFDFMAAWFIFKLVRLRFARGPLPYLAGVTVLFAPTVVLNSSAWAQCDSIFTAFLLACLYALLRRRQGWACLAFGLALAFKPQAVFLAPLLAALFLRRELSWKPLLLVPAVYVLSLVPAWLAGRPLGELLMIYGAQAQVATNRLTVNFPNLYWWVPNKYFSIFHPAGWVWTAGLALIYVGLIFKSRRALSPALLVRLALLSLMFMPYFLPKMHDRYLYPADVLSIAYVFFFPREFFVPVAVTLVSFFTYWFHLFVIAAIPGEVLALVLLAALIWVARQAVVDLYASRH
jgi:Gpi18-like mannosyltransferase